MEGGRYIKQSNGDLVRVEPAEDPPLVIPAEESEEDPEEEPEEEPEAEPDPE